MVVRSNIWWNAARAGRAKSSMQNSLLCMLIKLGMTLLFLTWQRIMQWYRDMVILIELEMTLNSPRHERGYIQENGSQTHLTGDDIVFPDMKAGACSGTGTG